MAANTAPIYSKVGQISWATVATQNTARDGTGSVGTIFTADAVNGGRVEKIRIRALGTNVATVLRVFINNGSTNTVAANNSLYTEMTIAATTAVDNAALLENEIPMSLVLPPGYVLNVTVGATIAAGLQVTAVGGKY